MFTGSIAALATPMDAEGALDVAAFERLLVLHANAGTHGVVVGGTTGESPTLSRGELCRLVEIAAGAVGGRMTILGGCGGNSTAHAMALARNLVAAGADGCLAVTPYYNRPPQRGLREHFLRLADAAGKPLVLYNVPGRTACDLLPETVATLASHPLIVAIKEATGSLERGERIIAECGDMLTLLSGDDATFVDLMALGARGVISVTANVAPETMAKICDHARAGEFDEALRLNATLAALHRALMIESNPMPVKWAPAKMGLIGETLRLPLVPLHERYFEQLEEALGKAGVMPEVLETA